MSNASPSLEPRTRIVDEGDDWIIVDKPPLVQAHPSKPGDHHTLWDEMRDLLAFEIACGGQVSIINRLDRETSGLTMIAKSRAAARLLCGEMAGRRIAKGYIALVHGWPTQEHWRVDAPLLRQGLKRPSPIHLKQAVHPDGAPSATRIQVERRLLAPDGLRFSLLRAFPETGRLHQIRVHLAHSGHSVVGDKIYGNDETCYLEFIETGWTAALQQRLLLRRHALHAATLQREATGQKWTSSLPDDLRAFVSGLAELTSAKNGGGNILFRPGQSPRVNP